MQTEGTVILNLPMPAPLRRQLRMIAASREIPMRKLIVDALAKVVSDCGEVQGKGHSTYKAQA